MLTQINTYEGVPVGSKNIEEFFDYVREFLGANFDFSTDLATGNGGYFSKDDFSFILKGDPATSATSATFFQPSVENNADIFGRFNNEYYKFRTLGSIANEPKVYTWELLPTKNSAVETSNFYIFENTDFSNRTLPYNPVAYVNSDEFATFSDLTTPYSAQQDGVYTVAITVNNVDAQQYDITLNGVDLGIVEEYSGGNVTDVFVFNVTGVTASDNIGLNNNTGVTNVTVSYRATVFPGYSAVTYNGITQARNTGYQNVISTTLGEFRTQSLNFTRLFYGAESPVPVDQFEKFNKNVLYGSNEANGISVNELISLFNNELHFNYTNFTLGAHIVLVRENSLGEKNYVYMSKDLSNTGPVTSGTYQVLDSSEGTIQLNISETQLDNLTFSNESFTNLADKQANIRFFVVSAEQLLVDRRNDITNYRSRYGRVYTGQDSLVELLSIEQAGEVITVNSTFNNVVTSEGDNLLRDAIQEYENATVLALRYPAVPNISEYTRVQNTRFVPDTFQLYFTAGIPGAPNQNNVRAFVEQNDSSWYNQAASDGSFNPVNRSVSTYISYAVESELSDSSIEFFNPTNVFSISDLITLKGLGDVKNVNGGSTFSGADDQTILKYNSSSNGGEFIATDHVLNTLNDVNISTGVAINQVLTFNGVDWVAKTVSGATGALGFTPLNRSGDTLSGPGRLEYSSPMPYTNNFDSDNTLATKQYIDEAIPTLVDETYVNSFTIDADTLQGNTASVFLQQPPTTDDTLTINGNFTITGDLTIQGSTSISGLDADLLDGFNSTDFVFVADKAQPNGVASLDATGKIPQGQMPAIALTETFVVANNVERDGLDVQEGDVAIVTETARTWIYSGSTWLEIVAADTVSTVNGQVGFVELDTDDIDEGSLNLYHTEQRVQDVINSRNDLVKSTDLNQIVELTQDEYDALVSPDPSVLYIITENI